MKNKKNDNNLWTYHQTTNKDYLKAGYPRQERIYKEITRHSSGGKVLEIGFGDGYLLERLSKKFTCTGADISEENIEQMKNKICNVSFAVIDVDGILPYKDDSFDYFIASEVLEHMSDDELEIVINEIRRVLKSDGIAILTFPAQENLGDNKCFCPNCSEVFHKWGHKQTFDNRQITELFGTFDIVKKKIFFTPVEGTIVEK